MKKRTRWDAAIEDVPVAPRQDHAEKVVDACNDPAKNACEIAALIRCDPAMESAVLRAAGRLKYGGHRTSSVDRAVVLLGVGAVKKLAGSKMNPAFDPQAKT